MSITSDIFFDFIFQYKLFAGAAEKSSDSEMRRKYYDTDTGEEDLKIRRTFLYFVKNYGKHFCIS